MTLLRRFVRSGNACGAGSSSSSASGPGAGRAGRGGAPVGLHQRRHVVEFLARRQARLAEEGGPVVQGGEPLEVRTEPAGVVDQLLPFALEHRYRRPSLSASSKARAIDS